MERDRRLTGRIRGQTDNPIAPPGFELNSAWKVLVLSFMVEEVNILQFICLELTTGF